MGHHRVEWLETHSVELLRMEHEQKMSIFCGPKIDYGYWNKPKKQQDPAPLGVKQIP